MHRWKSSLPAALRLCRKRDRGRVTAMNDYESEVNAISRSCPSCPFETTGICAKLNGVAGRMRHVEQVVQGFLDGWMRASLVVYASAALLGWGMEAMSSSVHLTQMDH